MQDLPQTDAEIDVEISRIDTEEDKCKWITNAFKNFHSRNNKISRFVLYTGRIIATSIISLVYDILPDMDIPQNRTLWAKHKTKTCHQTQTTEHDDAIDLPLSYCAKNRIFTTQITNEEILKTVDNLMEKFMSMKQMKQNGKLEIIVMRIMKQNVSRKA